jgi:hypothetical protein
MSAHLPFGGTIRAALAKTFTQNYFPTIGHLRLWTKSITELALCNLPLLVDECRDWPSCGLCADWGRTKVARCPVL